jgi:L-asparaginase
VRAAAPEAARLQIVSLGGTILGRRSPGGGYEPAVSIEEFVDALGPGLAASFDSVDWKSAPSADLRIEDIVGVSQVARRCADGGAAAVIVLCGTDTLEEVAFGLDVLWDRDEPIVVTGALRPPDALGADGQANVAAAVAVATTASAAGRGCLVVLNDEVHAARHVRKSHPSSLAAFASHPVGPIGGVSEGRVRFYADTWRSPAIRLPEGATPAPVALLQFTIGDDARLVDAVEAAGYRGLVIEGGGGGSVSARWAEALSRVAQRMPVVYASRTGAGPVLESTYGGPGGEIDLVRRGVQPAGVLDGRKARVLLSLLLASDSADVLGDFDRIADLERHRTTMNGDRA